MKKLLVLSLTIIGIFLIYCHFNNYKINYVSIGDNVMNNNLNTYTYNSFIKEYLIKKERLGTFNTAYFNKTVLSLYHDISNNRTIRDSHNEYFLKKVLRESDIVVISAGMEELSQNYSKYNMDYNYQYFDKMYQNIEKLINEVKKYAQGMILFLGYYNPTDYYDSKTDEFFYNIDIKLNGLMMNNDIIYIDLYELVKGHQYKDNLNLPYINNQANERIAKMIACYLE